MVFINLQIMVLLYALEVMPVLKEIDDETVILVVVYRRPGPVGLFIQDLIDILLELPTECRTFSIGDFNLDQLLYENILMLNDLWQQFHLHQRSHFAIHAHGGILHLIFDSGRCDPVT